MTALRRLTPALTAFALGEPILPIGYLPNGRPVFPIAGGAPDDPPADDPPKDDPPKFEPITSQADLDRVLGARLAREREKTAEKLAEVDTLREKAAKFDKAVEEAQTEQERAVKAAREEGKTEALTTANARLVSAEARALAAAAKFKDPADAVAFLDLKAVKVSDNGEVDQASITTALKDLAERKPYLVDDGKKQPPKPDKSQGGGGSPAGPGVDRGREMFQARKGTKTA